MSNPDHNPSHAADNTLSPEAQEAFAKVRRRFAFSMGIMLLGFMAIGFAVVYRVMRDSPPPTIADTVTLPAGAEVISAITTDGTIQITFTAGGATMLNVFDANSGELQRSVTIATQQ